MKIRDKKIGFGSTSSLLLIFGLVLSFTINGFTLGDNILKRLNMVVWSQTGFHYTIIYSAIIITVALLIGNKYPYHLFSIRFHLTAKHVIAVIAVFVLFFINLFI